QIAGQTPNAVTTYRGVVQSCTRLSDVVPTLEKANDVASTQEMASLFDLARQAGPSNTTQLNELEARLRAGRREGTTRTARATQPAPAPRAAPQPAA
ncbi:MAG: hypothetical protein KDJ96_05435, partial [Rhodobacteraceae bacterium]|nr:hypothetical protein [Paracoccaceae bacterium]